jgi:hypothetical protein
MNDHTSLIQELRNRFGEATIMPQTTCNAISTLWVSKDYVRQILRCLKAAVDRPYRTLCDLTAIDERVRGRLVPLIGRKPGAGRAHAIADNMAGSLSRSIHRHDSGHRCQVNLNSRMSIS